MAGLTAHQKGFLLTLFGVLALTPDTLLVRLIDSDPWTVTFTRGLLSGGTILTVFFLVRRREALREIRALGRSGLAIAGLYTVNSIAFVLAVHNTSVANVLVIIAASPLIAALMSYAILKERIAKATWVAILSGLAGVVIVVQDGLGRGTLAGDFSALVVAFSLAGSFVMIRRKKDLNMVPATGCGALLSALIVLPLASPLALGGMQIPYTLIMGLAVLPVAFGLITLGPRTVPAPEVALLMLLETVLGPLWVWMGVGEEPTEAAFVGGGVVIATLMLHSLWRLRRRQRAPA